MNNVIQVFNDDDVKTAMRSQEIRQRVGNAIAKAYRHSLWLVDVNLAGGIVTISNPNISKQYGMVLHLTHNLIDLEQRAVHMAGELLERFRISRETGDGSHLKRKFNGEALGASAGEQT